MFFLVLVSCSRKNGDDTSIIYIDLDASFAKNISFNELFDEVCLIPLETLDESLITHVTRAIFHEDAFYIFDRMQKSVFVFDESGKFRYKISNIGRGPGEYLEIEDITINHSLNTIDLLSPWGVIFRYSIWDGSFSESLNITDGIRAVHQLIYFGTDMVMFFQHYEKNKLRSYDTEKNKTINELYDLPVFTRMLPQTNYPFLYVLNDTLHFFHSYGNSIYYLIEEKITPKYTWNFGKYNFNPMDLNRNRDQEYYSKYLNDKSIAWYFFSAMETDNLVITGFSFQGLGVSLVYKKSSGEYYVLNEFSEGILFPLYPFTAGNNIFTLCMPDRIDFFIKDWMLHEKCREKVLQIQTFDNPVVLMYKPKI